MVAVPYIYCDTAGKRRYDSQITCLYDNASKNEPRAYRCGHCGGWHLTRNTNKFTSRRTWFGNGVLLHAGLAAKQFDAR